MSPFVDELRFEADARGRPAEARPPAPVPPRRAGDTVTAEPGLALTAPGGVPATVIRLGADRSRPGHTVMDLDVAGVRARLALDAPVLVDGQPARLAAKADRVRPPDPTGQRLLASSDDELTPGQQRRFDALREWRRQRASSDAVPPYIIFHDSHLRAMAVAAPSTLVALSRIPGVGPTKLERYGDEVLETLDALGSGEPAH
jgi:hypothetical protein